jgi:hypothetical protein
VVSATTSLTDPTNVTSLIAIDPVTGAVTQSTTAQSQPTIDPVTGAVTPATSTTTTAGSTAIPATDVIAKVTTLYINVGNSVIQRPVDQIIITDKPRAQTLVCR